jgi:hypothetical protein
MTEKTFVSFSEYKRQLLQKPNRQQTPEEMMAMCRMLNAAFGGEVVEI